MRVHFFPGRFFVELALLISGRGGLRDAARKGAPARATPSAIWPFARQEFTKAFGDDRRIKTTARTMHSTWNLPPASGREPEAKSAPDSPVARRGLPH